MTARAHRQPQTLDTPAEDLRAMIAELTRPTTHREQITATVGLTSVGHSHFTKHPALVMQLCDVDQTSTTGSRSGAGFESRPAASLEALDTLVMIDLEAARWVRDLGEDDPGDTLDRATGLPVNGSGTIACVSLLGGLVASATRCRRTRAHVDDDTGKVDCCTWHDVDRDVRRWWTQARIVTGLDSPAWAPDNTCPVCGERRSLRIRLEERMALCTKCRGTWSASTEPGYQQLADHIRSESDERRRAVVTAGPCLCVVPRAVATGLPGLCPRCGSATCAHAIRALPRKAM